MASYQEEEMLKQMGMSFSQMKSGSKPDLLAGKIALEGTLQEVKKTLWNMERHTLQTQSRLDKNNKSGPTYYNKKISGWGEPACLDMIGETLVEIQHTLETSAIAKKSKSDLEESIDDLKHSLEPTAEEIAEKKRAKTQEKTSAKKVTQEGGGGLLAGIGTFLLGGLGLALSPVLLVVATLIGAFNAIRNLAWFKVLESMARGTFSLFKKIFSPITAMFKWMMSTKLGESITKILKDPRFIAISTKVTEWLSPFTRLAFWLFSGYEFMQGWGHADKIFGKKEGEATLVEKFLAGIGSVMEFLSFGILKAGPMARFMKDPKKVWDEFDFDRDIVQPMIQIFTDFPDKVLAFVRGPLSTFGSDIGKTIKKFMFGTTKEGESEATGGVIGKIKEFFSEDNVVKAITGIAKMVGSFAKMIGTLIQYALIGGDGVWSDSNTWGGLAGALRDADYKKIFKTTVEGALGIIGWFGGIIGRLAESFSEWVKEKIKNIPFIGPTVSSAIEGTTAVIKKITTPIAWDIGKAPAMTNEMIETAVGLGGWMSRQGQNWNITSGYRSQDAQKKAMIGRADALGVGTNRYKGWQNLTPEEQTAGAGTEARIRGVEKLMAQQGFGGAHLHGNGIDFVAPGVPEGALRSFLKKRYPNAELKKESDHYHLSRKLGSVLPESTPQFLSDNPAVNMQLATGIGGLSREMLGSNPILVNTGGQSTVINEGNTQVLTGHAEDTDWARKYGVLGGAADWFSSKF